MKKIAPIIILTIISALFIFYRFVDIPKYLAFDEVEFAKLALSLQNKPYTPYSPLATGHSTLYFYILLASLKLFGINTFALRLPAAIFGILCVLLFYLIIKKIFQQLNNGTMKQWFPFFLSLIFLTSRWFLNFARFSFEATFLLFLELVSIYFLILANAKKSPPSPLEQKNLLPSIYLIISGLFAGLAFNSYTPGRIFFLLPFTFLVFKLVNSLTRKQFVNITIKRLLIFLIPFLIIITPLSFHLIKNKDTRIDQQFFLRNHEMTVNEKVNGLWSNVSSTTLMLFTKGDMNGRHNYPGKPALNLILGILFIVGLVITMKSVFAKASTDKQWSNDNNKLFLLYFLLSIFPALMTYPWENPNMLRTFTVIPSVVYFIGIASYNLSTIVSRLLTNKKNIFYYLIFIILILSSLYELRTYFKYQSKVFYDSFEIKWPLDKAIKLKDPYEKVP